MTESSQIPAEPPANPPPTRRRRGCLVAMAVLALILVIVSILAAGSILRWRTTPAGWSTMQQEVQMHDPQTRSRMAKDLEMRIAGMADVGIHDLAAADNPLPSGETATTQAAGMATATGETRIVKLSLDEINVWLTERFPQWAAHQGYSIPSQLSQFTCWTKGEELVLAFQYDSPKMKQVLSGHFHVAILPDGKALVQLTRIKGGEQTIPLGLIGQFMSAQGPGDEAARRLQEMARGITFNPVQRDGKRNLRLTDIRITEKGLELAVRSEPRPGR